MNKESKNNIVDEKTVKSKYGFSIKVACFTCKHSVGMGEMRTCNNEESVFYGTKVYRDAECSKHEVIEGLMNAGKGGGRVKSKKYLDMHLEYAKGEYSDPDLKNKLQKMEETGEKYIKI